MANIFINGLNAKAGGGKSILNNYLNFLKNTDFKHKYFVLTPNRNEYSQYSNDFIYIVDIHKYYKKKILLPFVYVFVLPSLLKKLKVKSCFNVSDLQIITKIPQVFLFDWSYAVYPESVVWDLMSLKDWFTRKAKLYFFIKNFNYISTLIAQTDVVKKRLESLYNFQHIKVIANAVPSENIDGGEPFDFNLPDGVKLLYLTYYYPHKNIEIFLPLAQEIKKRRLDYKLITTIEAEQHRKAKQFLNTVYKQNLDSIIINVGAVQMQHVPSLYKQCNALLMPTLLESFSATYIEAMFHKIPIFTSNIDFAKALCLEAAFYFDPFSVQSILDSIESAFSNEALRNTKIANGTEVLNNMPNWHEVSKKYNALIDDSLQAKPH